MFNGLRWRLTALYLVVALGLIALVGAGTHQLLSAYFRQTTDLALQHKLVHEFGLLDAPVPPELAAADQDWSTLRNPRRPSEHHDSDDDSYRHSDERATALAYDGELAAIFVLPLTSDGRVLFDPNPFTPPIPPDTQALATALGQGSDWRTIQLNDGSNVRLLTYRLTRAGGPAALQLGRILTDQDRIMAQLTTVLLGLGAVSTVLLGLGSWWLAGRSLRPAQAAWERQQTFIANASHELRTPLTLLRASAEVAQRSLPANDNDSRALLGDVLHECDHMTGLVEDLLLLSRLDAGRLSMERLTIPLPDLLADVQRQVGRLAAEKQITLLVQGRDGAACGDPARLRQVLLILLDNALRHTPPGGTITLTTTKDEGRRAKHADASLAHRPSSSVSIAVADTGSGIAPEHLPHIFERFYRADSARGASNNSGLGLSIAKSLIEAQHGQINIRSAPGQGTTVVVAFPAA